ncbi:right-handed parallel beta-helix repeat-containing protein (plasmid) [Photobacterium sp. GJ3]|uniref:right-handed parallel beta-helix repeat-containing protein n=1 Tax=Photobacterium sp. GJ3 TaxID=2829502 RepID=UPI001B8B3477|nr:right-handed parallel beta-helix repeat-containing protein [Photobacterium sp. GJ3]QUJ69676.1 right-handed parallel beta-helix repeat-containing protein [Photobacterium sp. GJ3]
MKLIPMLSLPVLFLSVTACTGDSDEKQASNVVESAFVENPDQYADPDTCGTLGVKSVPVLVPDLNQLIEVSDYTALKTALDSGYAYVKVPNGVTIEIPNQPGALSVGASQTLFGERGRAAQPGKLLVLPNSGIDEDRYPVMTLASHARVTGLIIEGPSQVSDTLKSTIAMQSQSDAVGIVVDNNEIFGWPWAGVSLKRSRDSQISHNFIHHNIKSELGYGVVVQNGETTADIRCNIFNHNRHAIAGSGALGEGYTASYNLVMQGGGKDAYHQFDMHEKDGYGGSYVHVYNNWFNYGDFGTANRSSIMIRAIPQQGSIEVTGNVFKSAVEISPGRPTVAGVAGSVPDEAALKENNQFAQVFEFLREEADQCVMKVAGQTIPVHCQSVSL